MMDLKINSFKLLENYIYFNDQSPLIYRFEINRTSYNVIKNSLFFINLTIALEDMSSYFKFNF